MEAFLTKLSSYNFINYIFPGVLLNYFCSKIFDIELLNNCTEIEKLFIYYFIGLFVSRIGSLILEPAVRKINFITYASYSDYVTAKAMDKDIETFLEIGNTYRTLAALFLFLTLICLFHMIFNFLNYCLKNTNQFMFIISGTLLSITFFICFLVSYKKQVGYIKKRITKTLTK